LKECPGVNDLVVFHDYLDREKPRTCSTLLLIVGQSTPRLANILAENSRTYFASDERAFTPTKHAVKQE